MSSAIAPDEPVTPESLWEALLYYIQCIVPMFGSARDIAEKHTLNRKEHFHLRGWLFRCEETLRRLLFIDAYKLLQTNGSRQSPIGSRVSVTTADARLPTAAPFDPDHPEQWRVSFKLCAYQSKPSAPRAHRSPRSTLEPVVPKRDNAWVILPDPRPAPPSTSSGWRTEEAAQVDRGRLPELVEGRRLALSEPRLTYDAYPLARRIEALGRAALDREAQAKRMARWLARQNVETLERFAQPTLTYQRYETMPGDFAVADAARLVAAIWEDFCMAWLTRPRVDSS